MQASEMNFFEKSMMFDKLCNTAIRESPNIESLLLRIERSQLRWLGHVSRMPQKRILKQTYIANSRVFIPKLFL